MYKNHKLENRVEKDRERQRKTETDRDRQRQTETDRDRQRQIERERRLVLLTQLLELEVRGRRNRGRREQERILSKQRGPTLELRNLLLDRKLSEQ